MPPVEVLEQFYPVLFEEFSLREGSGGAGEFRGGFGINYAIRLRRGEARVLDDQAGIDRALHNHLHDEAVPVHPAALVSRGNPGKPVGRFDLETTAQFHGLFQSSKSVHRTSSPSAGRPSWRHARGGSCILPSAHTRDTPHLPRSRASSTARFSTAAMATVDTW